MAKQRIVVVFHVDGEMKTLFRKNYSLYQIKVKNQAGPKKYPIKAEGLLSTIHINVLKKMVL